MTGVRDSGGLHIAKTAHGCPGKPGVVKLEGVEAQKPTLGHVSASREE